MILGREFIGRVSRVGGEASVREGDLVMVHMGLGEVHSCEEAPHLMGGFAERMIFPAERMTVLPEGLPPMAAVAFAGTGPVVLQSLYGMTAVRSAVVQGLGPMGLFAVLCLQSVCPEVYDWLAANLEELPMDRLNALKDLALQDEPSGEEPTPQFLLRLGLTDSQGTRVFSRWEFLRTFFAQIVECDWDGPEEMGNFDYAAPLGGAHEKIIRSAIRLAQLTRAEDGSITEDDCVAFLIANCEYWPTRTGSVGEAFALSCQYLLRGLETEQAVEAASYFPFLSADPSHLANPYDLHYPGAELYADQGWPAREVTARLEDLISYVREWDNSPVFLVWFKDKAGQQELWSYRSPLGEEDPEENFSFDLNLDEF